MNGIIWLGLIIGIDIEYWYWVLSRIGEFGFGLELKLLVWLPWLMVWVFNSVFLRIVIGAQERILSYKK